MMVNTDQSVPMTDTNQNFSKVVRMVDKDGMSVIMKNNQPRYVVIDFAEYEIIGPHSKLIAKTGGSNSVRDLGLLESAVYSAQTSFGGKRCIPQQQRKQHA